MKPIAEQIFMIYFIIVWILLLYGGRTYPVLKRPIIRVVGIVSVICAYVGTLYCDEIIKWLSGQRLFAYPH